MNMLFDRVNPEPCELAARRGMARATQHAEDVAPGWTAAALAFLVAYATRHATFYGWEVVRAAKGSDVPPDASGGKAWGSVIRLAQRRGLIRQTGVTGPDPHRHGNLIRQWGSRVQHGEEART